MTIKPVGRHAVVIGASMSGLLAARVLADASDQVTVLERDGFPQAGDARKGVPQGRHAHLLLAKGRKILEDLFPGFSDELVEQGALAGDPSERLRFCIDGGRHRRVRSGLDGLFATRPFLEAHVRTRLLALPNVHAIERCDVDGLATSADRRRVTGVRLRRDRAEGAEEVMDADLVVDAGGRGSRAPAWLDALGYPVPEEERVAVGVGYTSRFYRRTPAELRGDWGILVAPAPDAALKRGGAMIAQEGDRWLVTLAGYFGDHAPADEAGFLAYAKSLWRPDVYEVIKDAEPLSDFATYKYAASQRRRYERLTRFPQGFLVFGDAICSFNPLYGQGMTVAAMEAATLRDCLAEGAARLPRRFLTRASTVVDVPWSIAVGGDLRLPEVEGRRTPMLRFLNWYIGKVQIAARQDPAVTLAFAKVNNLVAPPTTILHPRIALRVLRATLRATRQATNVPGPAATLIGS